VAPFSAAETLAAWAAAPEDTFAVNVTDCAPAGAATLAGTTTVGLLLESPSVAATGRAALKLAVQLALPGGVTVDGLHDNDVSEADVD